jgi:hypothetical protein
MVDLHGAYNIMHIQEGDEWKTTFITHYDHFEYVVMLFGLTNMLGFFQHLMNDVFCEYLDDLVTLMTSFSQRTWKTMRTMYVWF